METRYVVYYHLSLLSLSVSDLALTAGNWPWWECLYQGKGQVLQIRAPSPAQSQLLATY